jgi:hypothetical protein
MQADAGADQMRATAVLGAKGMREVSLMCNGSIEMYYQWYLAAKDFGNIPPLCVRWTKLIFSSFNADSRYLLYKIRRSYIPFGAVFL